MNVLVREAEKLGVDGEPLREALTSHAMREKVIDEFREAAEVYDLSAIPAVILPGQPPIVGAVPLQTYREAAACDY